MFLASLKYSICWAFFYISTDIMFQWATVVLWWFMCDSQWSLHRSRWYEPNSHRLTEIIGLKIKPFDCSFIFLSGFGFYVDEHGNMVKKPQVIIPYCISWIWDKNSLIFSLSLSSLGFKRKDRKSCGDWSKHM